jgi:putative membrane protein
MKRMHLTLVLSAILIYGCKSNNTKSHQEASKDSTNAMAESMDNISNAAVDFATSAASSNMKEIALANAALKNANYSRLKELAQKIADAHTKANKDLQTACYSAGVTLPSGLSKSDQEEVDKVTGKDSKAFDRAFIKKIVSDQQKTMERLDNAAATMKDTSLRNYAKKTLPVVKANLQDARNVLEDVRKRYDPTQWDDVDSYQ